MSEGIERSDRRDTYEEVQFGPKSLAIPSDWTVERFGDVFTRRKESIDADEGETVRYVGLKHLDSGELDINGYDETGRERSSSRAFREGDVLFGKLRPNLNKAAIAPFDGVCSSDIIPIYAEDDVLQQYLPYLMHSKLVRDRVVSTMEGTNLPRTSWSDLEATRIPVPPRAEQRRIADILSTVDEQIQRTDESIEETEALKRGLMQDLLTTGTVADVATREETIGPMPIEIAENWEMEYFDDVIELNPNDDVPGEEAFPYLPMDAVNEETRAVDYWEERDAEDCTRVRFREGDTVYAKITPCTENGKIAFIEEPDGLAFGSTEFLVFRAREGRMLPKYVYYLANLPQFRAVTISLMEGSTGRQRVPSDTFEQNIRVPVPPIEEQRTIVETLDRVQQQSEQERETKQAYQDLKRGLMQDLLTGTVRVNESA